MAEKVYFTSYEQAYKRARRARNKANGARLGKRTRLVAGSGVVDLWVDKNLIATIFPSNEVLVFFPGKVSGYYYAKWLGLHTMRGPHGRIGIIHDKQIPRITTKSGIEISDQMRTKERLIPLVANLRFDMTTGVCLNPVPWPTRIENAEAALNWRRTWSKFRKGFAVAVKMGAFDHIKAVAKAPEVFLDDDQLYKIIVNDDYETMAYLVAAYAPSDLRWRYRARNIDPEEFFIRGLQSIYAGRRDKVRERAGCYIEEFPCEQPHEQGAKR